MADERTGIDLPTGLDATERIEHAGPSTPHLLIISHNGTWTSRSLSTGGVYTIGRGGDADVHLEDQAVSRQHARLEVGGAGDLRLVDLNSENATLVGNKLLRNATVAVRPNELFQIGRTVLAVRAPFPLVREPLPPPQPGLAMAHVNARVEKVAPTHYNVLLLGETGVGKGFIAERIHQLSTCARGPLMHLNCAALPATLLESELFGTEPGAYTDARKTRGVLEAAAGGTVFLDEVGDMPVEVQTKLLLAIERREIRPVGADRTKRIDVRFIFATNKDLETEIRHGRFRKDFYHRINDFSIHIPPLRERHDEIERLALQFARDEADNLKRGRSLAFDEDACAWLHRYDWKEGNIRELQKVVRRAVFFAEGDVVTSNDLEAVRLPEAGVPPIEPAGAEDRDRVIATLAACGGNQSRAARVLGMSRNTLRRRICLYNLPLPRGNRR